MRNYKELIIWQRSMDLVERAYLATETFPTSERFGLTSQMRRSATSIPSNIAEGCGRDTSGDFARFLRTAYASGCELETQAMIARRLELGDAAQLAELGERTDAVRRMIYAFIRQLATE